MSFVRVEQRNARLAAAVKVEFVKGREGDIAKGTVTIISNTRRGSGDERAEEATAIQWTLWGRQAENAAQYLGKGSRVNVVGLLRNNNYTDGEGREVYAFGFSCEELDYLDSKAESDARRSRKEWVESYDAKDKATVQASGAKGTHAPAARNGSARK